MKFSNENNMDTDFGFLSDDIEDLNENESTEKNINTEEGLQFNNKSNKENIV